MKWVYEHTDTPRLVDRGCKCCAKSPQSCPTLCDPMGFPGDSNGKDFEAAAMWETRVRSLGWEDPLEKGMATHSSILAWGIPWTKVPSKLQSTGPQRVGHDLANSMFTFHFHRIAGKTRSWPSSRHHQQKFWFALGMPCSLWKTDFCFYLHCFHQSQA